MRRPKRHREGRAPIRLGPALVFVLPALCAILLFSIYPAVKYIGAAFLNWRPPQALGDAPFVGLRWFREILGYYRLPQLIRNSVILGLWDISLVPVPMLLALAAHHCGISWLRRGLDVFALLPVFIPSVIVVATTQRILSTEGLLNQLLAPFGVAGENWLLRGELFYAYFSLSNLWSSLGFPYLLYKACLSASNTELHAAAQLDGASLFTRIARLDVPLCRGVLLTDLTLQVAGILNTSTERLLLFNNTANSSYSTTLDLYAYGLTFRSAMMPSYSKAIAFSLMTTLVNILLLFIARRIIARREDIYA